MINLPFQRKKSTLIGLFAAGLLATSLTAQAQSATDQPATTSSAAGQNSAATDARSDNASAGSSAGGMGATSGASGATGSATDSSGTSAAGSADTQMDSKVAASDRELMREIAQANLAEIETAKIAQSKSQSEEVKSFAQKMIDDHTTAQSELTTLAQAKGVQLPKEPDAKHKAAARKMEEMSASAFDKAYMRQSGMKDHSEVHRKLQSASKQAKDPELKAYVEKTTPVVADHLKMAKDMSGGMKAGSATSTGASGASGSTSSGSSGESSNGAGSSGGGAETSGSTGK